MKKLISYLLKTAVGKAIVEILINEFLNWLEGKGYRVYGTAEQHSRNMLPMLPVKQRQVINEFCKTELEKL